MRHRWSDVTAGALISALLVIDACFSQKTQSGGKKPQTYDEYDYGDRIPDYGGQKSDYHEVVDTRIQCYSCSYMTIDGHVQGLPNCNEPFVTFGIPEVLCNGQCSKHYFRYGNEPDSDYHIKRDCMPNCKEFFRHNTSLSYVQCCNRKLCNGDRSYSRVNRSTVGLLLLALFVASLDTVAKTFHFLS